MKRKQPTRGHNALTGTAITGLLFITILIAGMAAGCAFFSSITGETGSSIPSGTYTFDPRPQAYRGTDEAESYLNKIVVRDRQVAIHVSNRPEGLAVFGMGNEWNIHGGITLQDLDNPARTYSATGVDHSRDEGEGRVVLFENVSGSRFSLTDSYSNLKFEEFTLGEPD